MFNCTGNTDTTIIINTISNATRPFFKENQGGVDDGWLSYTLKPHHHHYLQSQKIEQLNQAIELGLQQSNDGKKIAAQASYKRLKKKLIR